jgi:hypothetical protein
MEQSPSWEANRSSATQEIPHILWNRMFIAAFTTARHLTLSWVRSSQSMPPPSYFLKIHINIMLSSMRGSPQWSHSLRFPHQNPVYTSPLPHTCYMFRPSHSSRLDHPNNICWGVQIIKLLIIKFAPFPCYLVPLRPKYSPTTPYFETPSAYVPPSVWAIKFHHLASYVFRSACICVSFRGLRLSIALSVNGVLDSS